MEKSKKTIKKLNGKDKKNCYKLFHYILYQQNKLNQKKKSGDFVLNNNTYDKFNNEKPIIIEHFINKENDNKYDLFYFNNQSSYSKKYFNLDHKFQSNNYASRNSISSKNSRINLSSIISEIFYKNNINKGINTFGQNENNLIFSDYKESNNNFHFFNKNIRDILIKTKKPNKLNFALITKSQFKKIKEEKKLLDEYNKYGKNNNMHKREFLFNQLVSKKRKLASTKNKRSKSCFFNNLPKFREYDDMNQRNRFKKIKKDLTEEKNKINNMISEFFKGPLYNKYNKMDKIEDLKLRNNLKRPRSALVL